MNISEFKGGRVLKFVAGILEKVRDNNKIEGDLEFYQLNKEIINEIGEIKNKTNNDNELLYKIIPIISNIEMDVTLEEFNNMLEIPTKQFMEVINQVVEIMNETLESTDTMVNIQNKVERLENTLNENLKNEESKESVKTKEEILDELYTQLSLPEIKVDKEKRMNILNKINELEVSV